MAMQLRGSAAGALKTAEFLPAPTIGTAPAAPPGHAFLEVPGPSPNSIRLSAKRPQQQQHQKQQQHEQPTGATSTPPSLASATCAGLVVAAAAAGTSTSNRRARRAKQGKACVTATGTSSVASGRGSPLTGISACQVGLSQMGPVVSLRSSVARRAMMFERFTEKTIKSVMLAQGESRRLAHDFVGSEMLLVGILAEAADVGFRALTQLDLKLPEARTKLEELLGRGDGGKALEIPFTTEAKRVLEDAIECAREQGSPSVSTGHLLRAILREEEGKGLEMLRGLLKYESAAVASDRVVSALTREESAEQSAGAPGKQDQSRAAASGNPQDEVKLEETLKYSQDLTAMAREGKLDPLVGREDELKRTVRILGRRSKNNPVLLGEAGVGKTTVAHGLAQRIAEGRVPMTLRDKIVVQVDMALLLAGTRYRGDFEERLKAIVKEVTSSNRRVILVIDEVHTLVGAGSSGGTEGGGIDAANLLKPALARGELQCIGATTIDEYRKYIERDPALERRFQPVNVPEPTEEEAVQILEGLAPKYERHHQLRYTPGALVLAVKLASQYIADRYLPDKAIDVMDEAGSKVRQQLYQDVGGAEIAEERKAVAEELDQVRQDKKAAVMAEQYDQAQKLKLHEVDLLNRLESLQNKVGSGGVSSQHLVEELQALKAQILEAVCSERFDEAHDLKAREIEVVNQLNQISGNQSSGVKTLLDRQVTEEDVAQVVAGWTGIAVEQVGATESARLMRLEDELRRSLIGQNDAVQAVSRALRRARAGLRNPVRPIAGFMFCGPTGVGKTELCKILSATFFGSEDTMIRLDMSEYMEKHTVSKLVGAPPGYVGYSDGGTLTEAVRRRPYSLVLFDEVEKAHPDVFNMMLQVLDDGRLTDSKGRTVSFANTLVVMTSNLGSRSVQKGAGGGLGLGFETAGDEDDSDYGRMKDLVHEEMKGFFRPEFLNRLDEMVVFRSLTRDNVREIAEVEFRKVLARLSERALDVKLSARFKEKVVEEGFDPAYGARPLRRAITRMLEDTLAEHVLSNAEGDEQSGSSASGSSGSGQVKAEEPRQVVEVDISGDGKVVVRSGSAMVFA